MVWGKLKMGTKTYKGKFLTFHQARRKARTLGLKSRKEWFDLCHSKKRAFDIPVMPHLTYKGCGWTNYPDFLGYKVGKEFLPFYKARKFVRSLGFKRTGEWLIKPRGIEEVYKDEL